MIHNHPQLSASDRLLARMAELDARFAKERECSRLAMEIVDRDLPHLPVASALDDGAGFMAGAARHGERRIRYRAELARLMAEDDSDLDAASHRMVAPL
jgi:hypothetical protein